MSNDITGILWRRLRYALSPQQDIYKHIASRVEGKHVEEIGFGTGAGTVQLAAKASTVTAIEIDEQAVQFAREMFPLPNVYWLVGDVTKGSNPHAVPTSVVCLEVLEHVPDWRAALSGMRDRIRGGELYISGPNANASLRKNDKHEREWTAEEFYNALSEYFGSVELYDYTLTEKQGMDTRVTPLVAICKDAI